MLTVVMTIEVEAPRAEEAMTIGKSESFAAKLANDTEPRMEPPGVLIQYSIDYPSADSSGPEQAAAISRMHELLESAGIAYDHRSNGVAVGDGFSSSRWVVRNVGDQDPSNSLTFTAVDRAGFEAQWAMIHPVPPSEVPGIEVLVYGLAALDANTSGPPFVQMPPTP